MSDLPGVGRKNLKNTRRRGDPKPSMASILIGRRIRAMLKARGFKQKEVAALLGFNENVFGRCLNDPQQEFSYGEIGAVAAATGVDLDAFDPERVPRWHCFHKSDTVELGRFHCAYAKAKRVISVSNALDSYLQEDGMVEWTNKDFLATPNWNEHVKGFLPYVKTQREARKRSSFIHLHASPLTYFNAAVGRSGEFLADLSDSLDDHEEVTVLSPIEQYRLLRKWIRPYLPPMAERWTKICIVDDIVALIHHPDSLYLACYHEAMIVALTERIEAGFAKYSAVPMPGKKEASLKQVRSAAQEGRNQVEAVLESKVRRLRKSR